MCFVRGVLEFVEFYGPILERNANFRNFQNVKHGLPLVCKIVLDLFLVLSPCVCLLSRAVDSMGQKGGSLAGAQCSAKNHRFLRGNFSRLDSARGSFLVRIPSGETFSLGFRPGKLFSPGRANVPKHDAMVRFKLYPDLYTTTNCPKPLVVSTTRDRRDAQD